MFESTAGLGKLLAAVGENSFAARIELLDEVGRGGMGVVYRGTDGKRDVAVKLLTANGAFDVRRFIAEAEILEGLSHDGIVGYIEHGAASDGRHYLVMDWLDGESLRERLKRGPLDLDKAISVARQIAAALAEAHSLGVVHRDLKPSNIMLTSDRAVLLDFGIARRTDSDGTTLTKTGEIVGTPGYFAPEQVSEEGDITERTDLFGLGCVLYEMLGGTRAFPGTDIVSLLVSVMTATPEPLSDEIPARVRSLVNALLAKDPSQRPDGAGKVRDELESISEAIADGDDSLSKRGPFKGPNAIAPSVRKPRRASHLLIAISLVIVGVGFFGWLAANYIDSEVKSELGPSSEARLPCDGLRREGCALRCTFGEDEACFRLGDSMSKGSHGYPTDREWGLALLRRGCTAGIGRSCQTAGSILQVLKNDVSAAAWGGDYLELLIRGCDLKAPGACRKAAKALREGSLVAQDNERAIRLQSRACELGDRYSCIKQASPAEPGSD